MKKSNDKKYEFPADAPPINYQPLAAGTDDVKNLQYGMEMFANYVWPHIAPCFSLDDSVVDLGAGTGRHSRFLSNFVKKVTAVDIGLNSKDPDHSGYDMTILDKVENAQKVCSDIMNFNPEEKFDVVFATGSFYYFYICYKEEAFRKMVSLMKTKNSVMVLIEGPENTRPYNLNDLIKKNNLVQLHKSVIPQWGSTGGFVTILATPENVNYALTKRTAYISKINAEIRNG